VFDLKPYTATLRRENQGFLSGFFTKIASIILSIQSKNGFIICCKGVIIGIKIGTENRN